MCTTLSRVYTVISECWLLFFLYINISIFVWPSVTRFLVLWFRLFSFLVQFHMSLGCVAASILGCSPVFRSSLEFALIPQCARGGISLGIFSIWILSFTLASAIYLLSFIIFNAIRCIKCICWFCCSTAVRLSAEPFNRAIFYLFFFSSRFFGIFDIFIMNM